MLFGLPKESFGFAGQPGTIVDKMQWARTYRGDNQPQSDHFFATRLRDSRAEAILLAKDDFAAFVEIDQDGWMTYAYELSLHAPGDWFSFELFTEIGQPYQRLFEPWKRLSVTRDTNDDRGVADYFVPFEPMEIRDGFSNEHVAGQSG